MEEDLVLWIIITEVLQERVSQSHDLLHLLVSLNHRNARQIRSQSEKKRVH